MAIAFDATSDGGQGNPVASLTFSHTCTGSNRFLVVAVMGSTVADRITGVTYAGTAMTRLDVFQILSGDRYVYLYYLVNPASGANNIVISSSPDDFIAGCGASYNGVKQTGQPDASQTTTAYNLTINNTLTTIANNCWHLGGGYSANGVNAGAGTTRRIMVSGGAQMALFDNDGAITPAGSHTIQMTNNNDTYLAGIIGLSIAPYLESVTGASLLMQLATA